MFPKTRKVLLRRGSGRSGENDGVRMFSRCRKDGNECVHSVGS